MSRNYEQQLYLVGINPNDRDDLLCALRSVSENDCDFNGENGIGYCWDETLENGFESNMDYLINKVKDIDDDEELIATYLNEWVGNDGYYYDYQYEVIKDENNKVIVLSLAYMTEC